MSDLISREEIVDILAKMEFFEGQRAGRELWNDKPTEVQEQDLESFNRDIHTIRKYIVHLEKSVEPVRGEWVNGMTCSNCGQVDWTRPNFCSTCGADMRRR